MPQFEYKSITAEGEVYRGKLEGDDQQDVVAHLHSIGHIPIQIYPASTGLQIRTFLPTIGPRKLKDEHICSFTRELATLLRAGLPLDRSLDVLITVTEASRITGVLTEVQREIKDGASLSTAMQRQQGLFDPFYINLLRAGESGGALEVVLERIAEHMERAMEVRAALVSALIYPAMLVFVAVSSILILLGYVVPQFTELFEDAGQILPLPTRITIALGSFMQDFWWLIALLLVGVLMAITRQLGEPEGRYRWHSRLLKMPLLGDIITKMEVARFAHTLGTLLQNGVPVLKSISIVITSVRNKVIADGLIRVSTSLKEGQRMADALAEFARFPAFAVQMIKVGEEAGNLEAMLLQVAKTYDRETRASIKRALTLVEPLLILILGVIIAAIIISILMAILSINELVF